MKFLHTMVRVRNLEESLNFYIDVLWLVEVRRKEIPEWEFTLVFLATELWAPEIELTYNWWSNETYETGRLWGHLAFEVDNIYEYCTMLQEKWITINRPPKEGRMAFIKSPDDVSIELLQKWDKLPIESPWKDMENIGTW
jgi:lactoylglutathione lyase